MFLIVKKNEPLTSGFYSTLTEMDTLYLYWQTFGLVSDIFVFEDKFKDKNAPSSHRKLSSFVPIKFLTLKHQRSILKGLLLQ